MGTKKTRQRTETFQLPTIHTERYVHYDELLKGLDALQARLMSHIKASFEGCGMDVPPMVSLTAEVESVRDSIVDDEDEKPNGLLSRQMKTLTTRVAAVMAAAGEEVGLATFPADAD